MAVRRRREDTTPMPHPEALGAFVIVNLQTVFLLSLSLIAREVDGHFNFSF